MCERRGAYGYDEQGCNSSECILLTFPLFAEMTEASRSEYLEDGTTWRTYSYT